LQGDLFSLRGIEGGLPTDASNPTNSHPHPPQTFTLDQAPFDGGFFNVGPSQQQMMSSTSYNYGQTVSPQQQHDPASLNLSFNRNVPSYHLQSLDTLPNVNTGTRAENDVYTSSFDSRLLLGSTSQELQQPQQVQAQQQGQQQSQLLHQQHQHHQQQQPHDSNESAESALLRGLGSEFF